MGRVPEFDPKKPRNPIQRAFRWMAKGRFGGWMALNVANKVDPVLMRASRGLLKMPSGAATVLLSHTGAKSGTERTSPLLYFRDGENLVIVASKGGYPKHPAWYHNLLAHPDVTVEVGTAVVPVTAHIAEGEARDLIWQRQKSDYPGFAEYEQKTSREIPVVILTPRR